MNPFTNPYFWQTGYLVLGSFFVIFMLILGGVFLVKDSIKKSEERITKRLELIVRASPALTDLTKEDLVKSLQGVK